MTIHFKPVYTLFWVKLEALPQEILAIFAYLCPIERVFAIPGLLEQSSGVAGKYRKPPEEHLEEDHTNRPDICSEIIGKTLHDFGCHSEVAA